MFRVAIRRDVTWSRCVVTTNSPHSALSPSLVLMKTAPINSSLPCQIVTSTVARVQLFLCRCKYVPNTLRNTHTSARHMTQTTPSLLQSGKLSACSLPVILKSSVQSTF